MLATPRYEHAKPGEIVGVSRASRRRTTSCSTAGFQRAQLRVDSMGRVVGPLESQPPKALPTLQLTIDARLQRAAEKAVADGIALARANGHAPDRRRGGRDEPVDRRDLRARELPDVQPGRAARDPEYLARLYRPDPARALVNRRSPASIRPARRSSRSSPKRRSQTGCITPYDAAPLQRLVHLGGTTSSNVEAGVYSSMTLPTALAESCDTWFYRLGDRFYAHPAAQGRSSTGRRSSGSGSRPAST